MFCRKILNKTKRTMQPKQSSFFFSFLLILFRFIGDAVSSQAERIGCPKCDRTYKSKKHLHRHLRKFDCGSQDSQDNPDPISTDSKLPNFRCSLCSYKTFRNVYLHRHIQVVHGMSVDGQQQWGIPPLGPFVQFNVYSRFFFPFLRFCKYTVAFLLSVNKCPDLFLL